MQKRYQLADGRILETQSDEAQIWVFINPDEAEKKFLINECKLDEYNVNSAIDPDEPTRLEFEEDHISIICKRPRNYSSKDYLMFKVSSIGFFLFNNRLIIVMSEEVPLFNGKQFQKVNSITEVMLKLIYRSIFHFLEHLKVINMISDELEQKINASMENKYLINLFTLEKSLVYYVNAIHSNGVLIEKLRNNAAKIRFSAEELEFLEDMMIENNQCFKQAEIYSNVLASLMDARASIVNNNLNMLMKTLNIIVIGIMVPTMVVSIFSMNVDLPLSREMPSFWIIILMSLIAMFSVLLFAKLKKY